MKEDKECEKCKVKLEYIEIFVEIVYTPKEIHYYWDLYECPKCKKRYKF